MLKAKLQRLCRAATQVAIRQAIATTAALPIDRQRSLIRSLVTLVGRTPFLRKKVRDNMRLALGLDVPAQTETLYFRHRAPHWLMGYAEWPQSGLVGSIFVLWAAIALVMVV